MEWLDGLPYGPRWAVRLVGLSLWQSLGFAAVLWAGRRPVALALPYGIVSAVGFLVLVTWPQAGGFPWPVLVYGALLLAAGIHFNRHIRKALHYGSDFPNPHMYRAGIICALPLMGPPLSLLVVAVVCLIRRRDRLSQFE